MRTTAATGKPSAAGSRLRVVAADGAGALEALNPLADCGSRQPDPAPQLREPEASVRLELPEDA